MNDLHTPPAIQEWLQTCQRWLNDCSRLSIRYGLSRKEVRAFHQLCLTSATLQGRYNTIVAPQFLLPAGRVTDISCMVPNGPCLDASYPPGKIQTVNPLHPLTDILLSECNRMRQDELSHALHQLTLSCIIPGVTEQLTLICWHGLINGYGANDILCLVGKAAYGIDDFIQYWRKHHPILFSQIEDYVFFACFSNWSTYR